MNTQALVKKSLLFAEQAADLQARTYQDAYPYLIGELVFNPTDKLLYRCKADSIGVTPDYTNPAIEGVTWEWVLGSVVGYVAGRGWWQKDADGTLTQWGGGYDAALAYIANAGVTFHPFTYIDLPTAFIDKTYSFSLSAIIAKDGMKSATGSARYNASSTTRVYAELWKTDTALTADTSWDWKAIGRWK